ncbi:PSP1 domain-containing protein [Thermogemmatispora tikiterensis]|uniref:Signal peptidase n=1 Tax=Thermogemmatispora tikiterensis TaxID=1825093 RepID=A0A328VK24_9CHLR|nr:stage 0 sporulation family protein [Thermogemmatispora tikiterensis]RAQ97261.1 signal peptidase [Thermogemmatispora tikiterensis]
MQPTVSATENVVTVVGIRFRPAGRIYYFDPQGQTYRTGQYVIVETVRGVEAGRVVIPAKKVAESELSDPLKPVLRLATEEELRMMLSYKSKEKEALVRCAQRIAQHKLPMKLVEAEYTFDGSRLTFYFTSDERVDFRALVRDLAATFRTRIELRQIGARDQAKLQGGVGPCGKTLCCSSWISDFGIISIKMAKEQGLPLNPAKISGVCGRLLCCLSYENENYIQAKKRMPQIGTILETPSGPGKVVSINVPKETVEVMLESGATIQVPVPQQQEPDPGPGPGRASSVGGGCCQTCRLNPHRQEEPATSSASAGCSCGSSGAGPCPRCGSQGGCKSGCSTSNATINQQRAD